MLLTRIEHHLQRHRMTPTRFGREAVGDPNLVEQLRRGRELRSATVQRVMNYLNNTELDG